MLKPIEKYPPPPPIANKENESGLVDIGMKTKNTKQYKPANGLAREDETANPGTNVFSSISIPNRSKSRLAPKANVVSKDETSFLTSANVYCD